MATRTRRAESPPNGNCAFPAIEENGVVLADAISADATMDFDAVSQEFSHLEVVSSDSWYHRVMADSEYSYIKTGLKVAREWFVIRGFDPGDCFTVFALLPAERGEASEDRMLRSSGSARESGSMVSIDSDTVWELLHPILVQHFDPRLPANIDQIDPCDRPCREPAFEWYGENAYTPDVVEGMLAELRAVDSEAARRVIELVSKVAEQARGFGTEVVFSGP